MDDICVKLEGAPSLDESLNIDNDREIRYFGPTSGRLEFKLDPGTYFFWYTSHHNVFTDATF